MGRRHELRLKQVLFPVELWQRNMEHRLRMKTRCKETEDNERDARTLRRQSSHDAAATRDASGLWWSHGAMEAERAASKTRDGQDGLDANEGWTSGRRRVQGGA